MFSLRNIMNVAAAAPSLIDIMPAGVVNPGRAKSSFKQNKRREAKRLARKVRRHG